MSYLCIKSYRLKLVLTFFIVQLSIGLVYCQKAKPTVYVVVSEECPICVNMTKPLGEIYDKYKEKVNFKMVFPLPLSNYKTMQLFKKKYAVDGFTSVLDEDQSVSKKLGATVTPEAIIENEKGQIVYRGRINDAYYAPGRLRRVSNKNDLIDAIEAVLNNKAVEKPWPKAVGCYVTFLK